MSLFTKYRSFQFEVTVIDITRLPKLKQMSWTITRLTRHYHLTLSSKRYSTVILSKSHRTCQWYSLTNKLLRWEYSEFSPLYKVNRMHNIQLPANKSKHHISFSKMLVTSPLHKHSWNTSSPIYMRWVKSSPVKLINDVTLHNTSSYHCMSYST